MARSVDLITAPTALRLIDAARHCSMSQDYFKRMVGEGFLPSPRMIGTEKRWLRQELDQHLFALPVADDRTPNPCDRLFA